MANFGESTVGLLFHRISSNQRPARQDIAALTSVFKGNFSSIEGIVARLVGQMLDFDKATAGSAQTQRVAAQSFNVLQGALLNYTGDLAKAKSLTGEFGLALKQAAAGNTELVGVFKSLGVNISQALESPKQGFAQFLAGFGKLSTEAEKAAVAEAVFLTTTDGIVPALSAAFCRHDHIRRNRRRQPLERSALDAAPFAAGRGRCRRLSSQSAVWVWQWVVCSA